MVYDTKKAAGAEDVPPTAREREQEIVEFVPKPRGWIIMAIGAAVPIAMSCAATAATYAGPSERVIMTAWIAVAIVGTASVISAAKASKTETRV